MKSNKFNPKIYNKRKFRDRIVELFEKIPEVKNIRFGNLNKPDLKVHIDYSKKSGRTNDKILSEMWDLEFKLAEEIPETYFYEYIYKRR